MKTDAPWPTWEAAQARVLEIQAKLHQRALDAPAHRFSDLFNLVYDPAFLVVAWRRVRDNRGSRSAGVDGCTAYDIRTGRGEETFLADLRRQLKTQQFRPLPVRERMIPKPGSKKRRRLGIPTVQDRVVQAALKLVLEPIFETDFQPCSYGFRPNRRAQDAIAEIHFFASRGYEWVLEGDISACFDAIAHTPLLQRVRARIGDRRLVRLVKAFCKSGILTETGRMSESTSGTPQGGILSPLLANIALSVLDEMYAEDWKASGSTSSARQARRRKGLATYRLIRYADDFVALVAGQKPQAEALQQQVSEVLAPLGLQLSQHKTLITHIDEGFDFLGFRIQRRQKRGSANRRVYTWPSRAALGTIKGRIRFLTRQDRHLPLTTLLHRLNPVLRGWTNYFRHGVSKRTFSYLRAFTWRRVVCWLRHKHPRSNWKTLRRQYLPEWWPTQDEVRLFNPDTVPVTRYRYRSHRIPSPWFGMCDGQSTR